MSAIDELLARHRAFAAAPRPEDGATGRPRLRVAILTCMDARIDIVAALGLRPGEVHLLRNAGGEVTDDVLRSLVISQHLLGTEEVMVVMHTDCGMQKFHDAGLASRLEAETQVPVPVALGSFTDLDAELRRGLDRVRSCPWLPHRDTVRGFVYDVATHTITEAEPVDA
jgi:carbonic anhydrase